MFSYKFTKIKLNVLILISLMVFPIKSSNGPTEIIAHPIENIFNSTSKDLVISSTNIQGQFNLIEPTTKGTQSILNSIVPGFASSFIKDIDTKTLLLATSGTLAVGTILVLGLGGDISTFISPEIIGMGINQFLATAKTTALTNISTQLVKSGLGGAVGATIALTMVDPQNEFVSNFITTSGLEALSIIASTQTVQKRLIGPATEKAKSTFEEIKQAFKSPKVIIGSLIVGGIVLASTYFLCPDVSQAAPYVASTVSTLMNTAILTAANTLGQKIFMFGKK